MPELEDIELLGQYARSQSETAFAALVQRHVNLVYSVALRKTASPHAAEEVTQAVFLILARKARSLSQRTVLSGWLYQTARLTAANYLRTEIRRAKREQEAYMQSLSNEPEPDVWPQIAPILEDAMGRLGEKDRNAIVLRFLEGKNLNEVGAALGASEDAAKMRVVRALEKLRTYFSKRGVVLTGAIIAGTVSVNSVQAAPVGLAATIAVTAVKGSAVAASTLTLVKGTMKMMTWMKLKFAAGVGVAALLAGGAATVAISQNRGDEKWTPQVIAGKSRDAYAALSSYSDSGIVVSTVGGTTLKHAFSIKLARPNLYRIEWEQPTAYFTNKGAVWSAGSGDFLDSNGRLNKRQNSADVAISTAAGISGGSSQTVPSAFLRLKNDLLNSFISSKELKLRNSEKINNVDCHVLTAQNLNNKKGVELTLWIGKADFLIHQRRQVMNPGAVKAMVAETSKSHPELGARLNTELASESVGMVETHENIVLNKTFPATDFAP